MDPDPVGELVEARSRARSLGDPLVDVCFLATCDAEGQPAVRPLALRHVSREGLGVLMSATSPKWRQLERAGRYELLLFWPTIARQYRLQGSARPMAADEVARYWANKHPTSRLLEHYYHESAPQSAPLASRGDLLAGVAALRARLGDPASPPPELRGLELVPARIEAWHGHGAERLHERWLYRRDDQGRWRGELLVP